MAGWEQQEIFPLDGSFMVMLIPHGTKQTFDQQKNKFPWSLLPNTFDNHMFEWMKQIIKFEQIDE